MSTLYSIISTITFTNTYVRLIWPKFYLPQHNNKNPYHQSMSVIFFDYHDFSRNQEKSFEDKLGIMSANSGARVILKILSLTDLSKA